MERSAVLSTHNNPQIQNAPCQWVQSYPPVSCGRLSFRRFVSCRYCCVRAFCWAFPLICRWIGISWLRMCGEPCERSSPYLSGISARCSHMQRMLSLLWDWGISSRPLSYPWYKAKGFAWQWAGVEWWLPRLFSAFWCGFPLCRLHYRWYASVWAVACPHEPNRWRHRKGIVALLAQIACQWWAFVILVAAPP